MWAYSLELMYSRPFHIQFVGLPACGHLFRELFLDSQECAVSEGSPAKGQESTVRSGCHCVGIQFESVDMSMWHS